MSRLQLASVAAQAGLCLAWSETPEDTFCHEVAHVEIQNEQYMKRHWSGTDTTHSKFGPRHQMGKEHKHLRQHNVK